MREIPEGKIPFIETLEEVDLAMWEKLKGCVIDGEEVPVHYYMPDMDIEEKQMPLIVFYRNGVVYDKSRYQNNIIEDNAEYDAEGNLLAYDKRPFPTPQNITYQVRTAYTEQMHGVLFQQFLARTFPDAGFLTVKGMNYRLDPLDAITGRYLSVLAGRPSGAQYKDFGQMKDGEREFGDIFNYRVEAYQDLQTASRVRTVRGLNVTTGNKEDESDV